MLAKGPKRISIIDLPTIQLTATGESMSGSRKTTRKNFRARICALSSNARPKAMAYSTMIAWSYYGLEGWIYLFGPSAGVKRTYNAIFCVSVVVGCTTQLDAILNFSDAMIFAMALANVLGLYMLAPVIRGELDAYWQKLASGEIRPFKERQDTR